MAAPALVGSFSPEQLEQRRKTLGASEIPVVAGYVKFKSPLALWAEKRGLVATFEGNEFTEWGNRLEPVIREKYAEVIGMPVVKLDGSIADLDEPWRSCTPDGLVGDHPNYERGLEIKCRGDYRAEDFGDPGTDQVPPDVAVQCHWSMDITGLKRWDVATLIGGNRFGLYHLFYDADIAKALRDIGRAFWKHVEDGTEPPVDSLSATSDFLLRRFPKNDEVLRDATEEEAEWIRQILAVRAEIKVLDACETEFGNQLRKAIGENAGIISSCGKATWKAPNGTQVAWKDVAHLLASEIAVLDKDQTAAAVLAKAVGYHSSPMSRRFLPLPPSKGKKGK